MKKVNRIKDNEEFSKVIKTGTFLKNNSYRFYFIKSDLNYVRIGIAVSKKVGNAVVRSTTRRKIRAICDKLIDYKSYSFDLVIMPKEKFFEQDYAINILDFENILEKIIGTKK